MSPQTLTQTLAGVDLFAGVPSEVLADLAAAGTTLTTPAGTPVVQQGSADAGLQVVLAGSAEVDVDGSERKPLGPGAYFGEISVIDGKGRSASVRAGADGLQTFAVSALQFAPLIDKHPALAKSLLNALCARIRTLEAATAGRAPA
jgi:CRP/FNR family transcriptional regulator, cyclic AMP receptor protein